MPELMVLRTRAEVRAWSRAEHQAGRRVAFVPTMGALHDGHVALMHAAAKHAERVLVSVFVNPTQFGPGEDFERYPRDEAGDLARIAAAGMHAAFLPSVDEMYPPGAATKVEVPTLAATLCGRSRPTHFGGVCLVVAKLFNMTGCDVAVFGEKDFQQLAIIRRMTRDLDLPVEVVGHPIVRETDGLAMSSRNAYLDDDQRREARALSQALRIAEAAFAGGERDAKALWALAFARVRTAKCGEVDYCEVVDAETLQPIEGPITRPALLALAVRFGATRLIDNTVLNP